MSNQSLAERNEKIRKRMLDVSDVKLVSCPPDSPWLKPLRLSFKQDGKLKIWDFVKAHDSVSIIIFNISRKKLVFVRQFRPVRYYSYFSNDEKALNQADVEKYPASLGLAIELCGGIVDKNKSLVEIVQEEVLEECGYEVPLSAFEKIITYQFVAFTATQQTLYYVEVTDEMNTHPGGGAEEEGELIEIIEMSVDELKEYISSEVVQSPPSFLNGVSWFLANKKHRYT